MISQLTVLAKDTPTELRWAKELQKAVHGLAEAEITCASEAQELAPIVFIDGTVPDLNSILGRMDRKGRAFFLIMKEDAGIPAALVDNKVDDVLIFPFRPLEVFGKLRQFQQILLWEEVSKLNTSFSDMIGRFHLDLELAERLQKSRVPVRFDDIRGFHIQNRYLAGIKSGGDYFDIAESRDGSQISVLLSDSSSYGLSSAVLSVLMRVAMKLSSDETRSCRETVRKIHQEIKLMLNAKEHLSLFYGVVSRRDYRMRFLNLGTACAFYASPEGMFAELPVQGEAIRQKSGLPEAAEGEVILLPESRLVLLSDGFVEAAGGPQATVELLNRFRKKGGVDTLNEFAFKVKSQFKESEDMPAQDCTGLVFDIDARVMRVI